MMFIKPIVAAAVLSVSVVTAAPADLSARQDNRQISLCIDPNRSDCWDFTWTAGRCSDLSSNLDDKITSIDTRDVSCQFYRDHGCSGPYFTYDGIVSDILKLPQIAYLNDAVSSWVCNP
ncbi:uncharacterized protein L3040_001781 [Drepanopeziza brunnea f. sp. 'multigermtubi']|uniref:uncharacterized protein n=1 Tax=Drepanopeziza brunnea f. sp. 'multigermtubi' TaxID=698441 RepID=UPI0023962791|nr:hypothetical protein L3040_001781 [Drepanopeziza brunnea f. sp. 'multigermtubi']